MKKLPHTPYVLVGRCLAPTLTGEQKAALAKDLSRTAISREELLAEANRQQCTPLWYLRLKEYGLLDLLPPDLQAYLAHLTAANRVRNRRLKKELIATVARLSAEGIPVLLLKGAATFVDRLYEDEGARLMADLDLLIPDDQVERAKQVLIDAGYMEDPDATNRRKRFPLNAPHCHLPALRQSEKSAVVELHYKVAYGQSGRVMDTQDAWQASLTGELDGLPVRYLAPTQRLPNNALHAALPHMKFLRGQFALRDLAEFAVLLNRYGQDIDRTPLFKVIEMHRLQSEFTTYARIAHLLMHTNFILSKDISTIVHTRRILSAAGQRHPSAVAAMVRRAYANAYYFTRLPRWAKQNVFYGDGGASNWRRFGSLVSSLFNARFSP